MIGALFSLMFMIVGLAIQMLVWAIRLTFLMFALMFRMVGELSSTHNHRRGHRS